MRNHSFVLLEAMPTSFSQWWNALVRHRLTAALAFAAIGLLTVLVIIFSPRSYRSTSRLLLRIGHESASLDPTVAITGDMMMPLQTRENEIETALGVMHSRLILEEVVDRVGVKQILGGSPHSAEQTADESPGLLSRVTGPIKEGLRNIDPVSDRESAIRELVRGFAITAPSKSSVVTVEYKAAYPVVAQNIVRAWVESYLGQHSKVNRTHGTYPFFAEQDAAIKSQLDAAHLELRQAKTRGGFATLEGQQKLLEVQLETVLRDLLQVDADLVESASRIESVGGLLASDVDATTTEEVRGIANEARDEMRGLLFQLEVLENEYAAKYKESHPKLAAIRNQLADARKIVDSQDTERKEFRESANPTHQQLSENRLLDIATHKALQEKRQTLLKQHGELLESVNDLNMHEEELAKLTRRVDMLEERYRLNSVRLEQSRLDELLEERRITSINVIQPASLEERPVSPNKALCAVIGMLVAIAVAISLPVLFDAPAVLFSNHPDSTAAFPSREIVDANDSVASEPSRQAVASSALPVGESDMLFGSGPAVQPSSRPR